MKRNAHTAVAMLALADTAQTGLSAAMDVDVPKVSAMSDAERADILMASENILQNHRSGVRG